MNYENRIVLFLDILGFKTIIDQTVEKHEDNSDSIQKLYSKFDEISKFLDLRLNQKDIYPERNFSLMVTQFSDSIIISFINDDNTTLLKLIRTIQELIINFVNSGMLCRGAISYGKLIHDNRIIFGPALNDAYETETKAAMYPRVILDKSIIELNKEKKKKNLFEDELNNEHLILGYLSKDTDEKYYINYFPQDIGEYRYITDIQSYLIKLRQIIINGSKSTKPDLKVKYGWMKNKYNNLLNILQNKNKKYESVKVKELSNYIAKLNQLN